MSVIRGVGYILAHAPDMVLSCGTTQTTERILNPDSEYLKAVSPALRSYEDVVAYMPNQVYIGGAEPEAISVDDIVKKYARHTDGKIIETTEEILAAYTELKELKEEIKALEIRKDALEETIKMAFGDAEAISYGGKTLATWKAAKDSEKFDSKAFCSANPDVSMKYMVVVPGTRRFLIK